MNFLIRTHLSRLFKQPLFHITSLGYNMQNSYRCDYGQGGILSLSLQKLVYSLKLETIWDDFTEIETWKKNDQKEIFFQTQQSGAKNEIFSLNDENLQKEATDETYYLKIRIPEYYSYKFNMMGSIEHIRGLIDAKTSGNVEVSTGLEKGFISLNKVRSEKCSLQSQNGKITVLSGLETQTLNVSSKNGEILIKKLLVAGKGYVFSSSGIVNIGSFYGKIKEKKPEEQIEYDDIPTEIHKENFLSVNTVNSNIVIGNVHGNLIAQSIKGDIFINRCNCNQFMLENESGKVHLRLNAISESSLIKLKGKKQLTLEIHPGFNGNVFLVDQQRFWREDKKKDLAPTLYIKGDVENDDIKYNSKDNLHIFLNK